MADIDVEAAVDELCTANDEDGETEILWLFYREIVRTFQRDII